QASGWLPREAPRDRAQVLDAAAAFARHGPRADVETLDHVDRRRVAEIMRELGPVVDQPLVRLPARLRDALHHRFPFRLPRIALARPGEEPQERAHRLLEAAHRDAAQAVLRVDRLALLGHP